MDATGLTRHPDGPTLVGVTDSLDVDAMLARFRDRAMRVRDRPIPPVAGPERQKFLDAAATDFQDFAMLADATWEFEDGILTLRIDLRPSDDAS